MKHLCCWLRVFRTAVFVMKFSFFAFTLLGTDPLHMLENSLTENLFSLTPALSVIHNSVFELTKWCHFSRTCTVHLIVLQIPLEILLSLSAALFVLTHSFQVPHLLFSAVVCVAMFPINLEISLITKKDWKTTQMTERQIGQMEITATKFFKNKRKRANDVVTQVTVVEYRR